MKKRDAIYREACKNTVPTVGLISVAAQAQTVTKMPPTKTNKPERRPILPFFCHVVRPSRHFSSPCDVVVP